MIIYQIRLPKKEDAEAFVKFMHEEYFPAVHKGATRVGQVTDLVLLQAEHEGRTTGCEFFWHVGWSGQPSGKPQVDDGEVARKLESFKARIKRIGSYREVAAWHKGDVA
jgi:hypothetical protein